MASTNFVRVWGSTFNPRFLDKSEQLPEKSKLGLNEVEIKPKCWLISMGTRHWEKKKSWCGGAEAYLPQRHKELLHNLGIGASLLQRELRAFEEMGRKQLRLYGNR